jgi:hypothetical protein
LGMAAETRPWSSRLTSSFGLGGNGHSSGEALYVAREEVAAELTRLREALEDLVELAMVRPLSGDEQATYLELAARQVALMNRELRS